MMDAAIYNVNQYDTIPYVEKEVISQRDKDIVASCLIGEAGGEGRAGMIAVMNVIQNRAKTSDRFVSTVLKRKQFSMFNQATENGINEDILNQVIERSKNHPCWSQALEISNKAWNGMLKDSTHGATHYYALNGMKNKQPPYWANSMKETCKIGNHTFLK